MSRLVQLALTALLWVHATALAQGQAASQVQTIPGLQLKQSKVTDFVPLTDADLRNPDASDWPMYRRNFEGWGYSPLNQITAGNISRLRLVWSRVMEPGWQQATPIVHNGVIYIGAARDVIQAIDARHGDLIWEYRRNHKEVERYNMLGQNKRSIALYGDKVYFVSWDNFIVALDARTGSLAWETDRGQATEGVSNSTGPIVANGVVVAGTTCEYAGHECYVSGHDAVSGRELWRNHFLPKRGEPGYETWVGAADSSRWATSSWGPITYDPELDLIYYGSNGAMPAAEWQRKTVGGTIAGTNTRFAVRSKTGELVWRHQVLPRDNWEQDCVFDMLPVTSAVNPDANADGMMAVGKVKKQKRKVLVGVPCKTGVAWAFDAANGEFLWAKSTVKQDLISSIDSKGRVKVNAAMVLSDPSKETLFQCPGYGGGRDWPPSAYSPTRNVIYVPGNNMCSNVTVMQEEPVPEAAYNTDISFTPAPDSDRIGRIDAISVETGKTVWTYQQPAVLYSPVLATAGDLLFTGGFDRYFRALDQADGKVLWETRLPSQATGHPVSYAIDGKQYIAMPAGGGLVAGFFQSVQPAIDGAVGGNALFVFALAE